MPNEKVFIDSKTISAIRYNDKKEILTITFVTKKTYDYAKVPRHVFDAMLEEKESIGSFVNKYIKGVYPYKLAN